MPWSEFLDSSHPADSYRESLAATISSCWSNCRFTSTLHFFVGIFLMRKRVHLVVPHKENKYWLVARGERGALTRKES